MQKETLNMYPSSTYTPTKVNSTDPCQKKILSKEYFDKQNTCRYSFWDTIHSLSLKQELSPFLGIFLVKKGITGCLFLENKAIIVYTLAQKFEDVTALDGLSLEVEKGELFTILYQLYHNVILGSLGAPMHKKD